MKGENEDWHPAPQWSREPCADLEAEARRLAKLMTTAQRRSEEAGRRLRSRLDGYVPIDEVFQAMDTEEANGNGLPYPRKLHELADEARRQSNDPFRERKGPRYE